MPIRLDSQNADFAERFRSLLALKREAAQDVEQNVDRSVDRSPDATGETDDFTGAVANRADAMQRLLDACAIIGPERRDARAHVRDVFVAYRGVGQILKVVFEARLGRPSKIQDDFDDVFDVV